MKCSDAFNRRVKRAYRVGRTMKRQSRDGRREEMGDEGYIY